jgi:hypothetical protein
MYDVDVNVVAQTITIPKDDLSYTVIFERPIKNVLIDYTSTTSETRIRINDTDVIKAITRPFDFTYTNLIVKKIEFIFTNTRMSDTEVYYQGIN